MKPWLTLLAALVAGCAASAPPTRFHTLMPPPQAASAPAAPRLALRIAPVQVPAQVDQPQWVLRAADGSLQVLEQQRWAAPLADEWRAALSERLQRELNAIDLGALAHDARTAPVLPVFRLQVELQRFESGATVLQQAVWSLRRDDSVLLACRSVASEAGGDGYEAIAAAHRAALAHIASDIAAALRALADNAPARCP